jgi:VWFA-related protein
MRQALDDIQRTWNQSRDSTGAANQQMAQIPGSNLGGVGATTGGSPRDVTGAAGSLSSGNVPSSCQIFDSRVEAILSSWMQARTNSISVTLTSLGDTSTYLAGLPGTKSLLYLSDALETMPGQALSDYASTICPGGQQNLAMNALGEQLGSAFIALTRHAAANRVTIYSLQGGGLQVSSSGSARDSGVRPGSIASFEASRRAGDQAGLITLAEETGGRAAMSMNDYSLALDELSTEMLSFYSMAYQPPATDARGSHSIEVRVRDEGLKARFRRGYVDKSQDQRLSESLQGALYLGLVNNPLEARLAADAFRPGDEGVLIMPLRIVLPVELVSFIPDGDQLMANVLVRIMSRDLGTGQTISADRPFKVKHQPGSEGEWMQLPVDLPLTPGSHLVAIGVLDQESGMKSLVSTTIEVPSS